MSNNIIFNNEKFIWCIDSYTLSFYFFPRNNIFYYTLKCESIDNEIRLAYD